VAIRPIKNDHTVMHGNGCSIRTENWVIRLFFFLERSEDIKKSIPSSLSCPWDEREALPRNQSPTSIRSHAGTGASDRQEKLISCRDRYRIVTATVACCPLSYGPTGTVFTPEMVSDDDRLRRFTKREECLPKRECSNTYRWRKHTIAKVLSSSDLPPPMTLGGG
jgi:hypothetical protein